MTRKVVGRSTGLNPQRRPKQNEATAEEDAVEVPVEDQERQVRDSNMIKLGKGSKIKLIIFAEFSAKGYFPPLPLSRKIINFSPTFWMSGREGRGRVGGSFICLYLIVCFRAF